MSLPRHVAIIMDGNGRWAQQRGRARPYGHIKGTRAARRIINHCAQSGIKYLTLYAFSSENWQRPEAEISVLMLMLERYLQRQRNILMKNNIRFRCIGETERLPENVQKQITESFEQTRSNTGMTLTLALSYGSRQELTSAVKTLAKRVQQTELSPEDISEDLISRTLMTAPIPDPDLVIRTSGESRLSNFLMWQCAYSELYFTDTLWPDFDIEKFNEALGSFSSRERRFGGIQPLEPTKEDPNWPT